MRHRSFLPRTSLGILSLALLAGPALAQEAVEMWSNLNQLRAGDRIEVVDQKLTALKGTFVGVSHEALSLRVGDQEVAMARSDVFRVGVRSQEGRTRRMLLGLAIGAGAGFGAAILIWKASVDEVACSDSAGCKGAIAAPFVGAGLGLAAGLAPGYRTVYRTARKTP